MVNSEAVKQICDLGEALWADPMLLQSRALETVSVVSLLNLTQDQTLERVSSALLERVDRDGTRAITAALFSPFFRLYSTERFILAALHRCRWSYSRIAKVLKISPTQVAELAWQARLRLSPPQNYPVGSGTTIDCPPYSTKDPWTQRFLDEELSQAERLSLQHHMQICEACRDTLQRCRRFYYEVDKHLPIDQAGRSVLQESLEDVMQSTQKWMRPSERSFLESLSVFTQRKEVRLALALMVALVFYRLLSSPL